MGVVVGSAARIVEAASEPVSGPDLSRVHPALAVSARLASSSFPGLRSDILLSSGADTWRSLPDGRFVESDIPAPIGPDLDWNAEAGCASAPIRTDAGVIGCVRLRDSEFLPYDQAFANRLLDIAELVGREADRALNGLAATAAPAPAPVESAMGAREFTAAFVKAVPLSVIMTDMNFTLISTSQRWRVGVGVGEDIEGVKTLFDIFPTMREEWQPIIEKALSGVPARTERSPFKLANGEKHWFQNEMICWRDDSGEVGGLLIISQDVTELAKALRDAKRSEQRLNLAAEMGGIHVYEVDYVAKTLFKVGAEDTFFEKPLTFDDVAGEPWGSVHPDDREMAAAAYEQQKSDGRGTFQAEYRLNRSDGKEVWAASCFEMLYDDKGRPTRLVGALRNITQRKLAEQAMEQAKEESEQANKSKSEFLANMSHEIRTPMNGIIGMNALLLRTQLTPDQQKFADAVRVSADCLLGIINDILDISKLEAGKVELETIDFSLETVVEDVVELLSPRALEKSLEIACYLDDGGRQPMRGDPTRIRQVLLNLLSNALKFTDEGYVSVEVRSKPAQDGRTALRLEVHDTGIGLSPEAKSKLFQKFQQADGSITRRFGGTGLGLSICRQLVELMGGRIDVEDRPGGGSIFFVELALENAQGQIQARRRAPTGLKGVKILVVDDIEINRSIFTRQLEADGATVLEADGGELALEMIRQADMMGEPYDIILLDHMMPGMAGDRVAEEIRAYPMDVQPKLVLASSVGVPLSSERSAVAFDAMLTKPVRHQALVDCLCDLVADHAPSIDAEPAAEAPAPQTAPAVQGRILLAEDNEINTMLASTILEEAGYTVECAVNGVKALEAASKGGFDLILMDVQMPEMDGLQATREIRRLPGALGLTPIVAMTANAMRSDQDNCMAAGMDDFVSKPIDPDSFLSVVQRFIVSKPQAAALLAPTAQPALPDLDEAHLGALAKLLPADRFQSIVGSYVTAAKDRLARIEGRARDMDFINVARDAHDMKGTSGNFGARRLQALAEQLEQACRNEDALSMASIIVEIKAASLAAWEQVERYVASVAKK